MKLPLVTPIYKDTVYIWTYSSGLVNQTGMIYIDNLEYQISSGMLQSLYLLRMHNQEGYADNVTMNPYGPFYYYYHKDHLGNNKEVWKAAYSINGTVTPAAVVQQTSYYPSGLPWSDGSGVSAQPYKYNGKEFVEMHGLDTYDYGARGYYPAMGRFMTVDPLAEKYYSISPYAYCAGNPVRYVDIKGKYLVDPNGKTAVRINNSLMKTNEGRIQWNNMVKADYPISLTINTIDINKTTDANNIDHYKLGNTQNSIELKTGKVLKSDITIYEATINSFMKDTKNSKDPLAQSFQNNTKDNDQIIGAVAGHESNHATDAVNQKQSFDNKYNGSTNDLEAIPTQIEMRILDQTGLNNLELLPNPLSIPLKVSQPEPINVPK